MDNYESDFTHADAGMERCPDCRAWLPEGRETNECMECGTFLCDECGDGLEEHDMTDGGRVCLDCHDFAQGK